MRTSMVRTVVVAVLSAVAAPAAPLALLEMKPGFDAKSVTVNPGATLECLTVADKVALRIATDNAHDWPGIEIPAPAGRWDLSAFTYVELDLANPGANEVRVDCRVDNPGVERGVVNCVGDGLSLAPGAAAKLRVELRRRKPDWIKVEMFGMRGYP